MKKILTLAVVVGLIACSRVIAPTQADADRAAEKWPGTTVAELNDGKAIYEANCGKCHNLKRPASRTEESWRNIVPPMAKKAKLDPHQEELVLKYVVAMSGHKK